MRDSLRRRHAQPTRLDESHAACKQALRIHWSQGLGLNVNCNNHSSNRKTRRKGWRRIVRNGRRSLRRDRSLYFVLCTLYFVLCSSYRENRTNKERSTK